MSITILDNLEKIKKIDKQGTMRSIELLYAQIRQVLEESRLIKIPFGYNKVNKVVVNGMGGSNLGAEIIKAVFADELKTPILITPGYEVPAYVDANTLYVISSYSGTTEEPLSVYKEVKKRGAKIMAITNGPGKTLAKLMLKENIPGYICKDVKNVCHVPRYGVGYSVFGMMTILAKAGLFEIKVKEIERMIGDLELWDHELRPDVKAKHNIAKQLASVLVKKQVVLVGAEFLQGSIHTFRNQICETGKNFASYLLLPDISHFAMEGLAFPRTNKITTTFLFINSHLYHPRIQKRSKLTKQVVKKNKIKAYEYNLVGETKLEQAFELLQLGSWVTFYMAMLNGVNPAPNPWVDWFKEELK